MVNIQGTLLGDDGKTYNIAITAAAQPAQATTTVVSVSPASPQPVGASITVEADVTPSTAPGTVTFSGTGDSTPVPVVAGVARRTFLVAAAGTLTLGAAFTPSDPTAFNASTASPISYTVSSGETPLTKSSYSTSTLWAWTFDTSLGNTASNDQYFECDFAGLIDNDHNAGCELRANGTDFAGIVVSLANTNIQIQNPGSSNDFTITRAASSSGHLRVELSGLVVKVYINGTLIATQTVAPSPAPTAKGVRAVIWQATTGATLTNIVASSLGAVAPLTIPGAPTLSGTTGGSGSAVLSWTPADSNATSYKVFQAGTQIATTSQTSYTVSGLTNGTAYGFTVKASNSAGDSTASNTATVTPSAGTSSGAFKLGAAGTGVGNGALDRWMTHGPGVILAASTWSDNQSYGFTNLTNEYGSWGTQPGQLIDVAVGGIWGDSWANAASGSWDSYWTQKLKDLKSAWGVRPVSNLRVRFAHEFNGNWFAWSVNGSDATAFKNAFARWNSILKATIPGALSVWSPNDGSSGSIDVTQYWPGLAAADRVGVDSYNQYPHSVSASSVQSDHFTSDHGFETWRQRCATWGVTMCLPEWGNAGKDSGGGAGGGESPEYINAVFAWAKSNGGVGAGKVEYANYFNIQQGYPAYFQMFDGSGADSVQPQTAAAFRAF